MGKRYEFTKGEVIDGTQLTYICEGGYRSKHRLVICSCNRCGTIRPFRLESITKGRTRSCGCVIKERMEKGELAAIAYNNKKGKWWLKKGGWQNRDTDVFICVPAQYIDAVSDVTIGEVVRKAKV